MTKDPKTRQRKLSRYRFLNSPLIHFFAMGGLVFASFAVLDDRPKVETDTIDLSTTDARQLADQFESSWNRPPTPDEMTQLMQAWVLEEAVVREALALGLDRGDAVIRQRLNVKMRFLAESRAAALEPDDATLQTYLVQNPDRFEMPPRIAFRQLFAEKAPADRITKIRASLDAGGDPSDLGEASLLPQDVSLVGTPTIDRIFGSGFAEALQALPDGEWAGPVTSSYGQHLVLITDRRAGGLPPLDQIRDRVESEWRASEADKMRESFGQDLLSRYQVVLPNSDEVLSQ